MKLGYFPVPSLRHTVGGLTDGLRRDDVHEAGREEDKEDGQADPREVLQGDVLGQVAVQPHAR